MHTCSEKKGVFGVAKYIIKCMSIIYFLGFFIKNIKKRFDF